VLFLTQQNMDKIQKPSVCVCVCVCVYVSSFVCHFTSFLSFCLYACTYTFCLFFVCWFLYYAVSYCERPILNLLFLLSSNTNSSCPLSCVPFFLSLVLCLFLYFLLFSFISLPFLFSFLCYVFTLNFFCSPLLKPFLLYFPLLASLLPCYLPVSGTSTVTY